MRPILVAVAVPCAAVGAAAALAGFNAPGWFVVFGSISILLLILAVLSLDRIERLLVLLCMYEDQKARTRLPEHER